MGLLGDGGTHRTAGRVGDGRAWVEGGSDDGAVQAVSEGGVSTGAAPHRAEGVRHGVELGHDPEVLLDQAKRTG